MKYWSNSRFADWIRGTKKPYAATSEEWHDWRVLAQKVHSTRYWIAETALDNIQEFVRAPMDFLYSIKYYVNNRWVTGTHTLTSHSLEKGQWYDMDTRLLHCMFDELVNYVEIELAWSNIAWNKDARKKYRAPFWAAGWFRWRTWRCPEAGVDYLNWATELICDESHGYPPEHPNFQKPTEQAKNSQEILDLYVWWTQTRPARRDPYEASGWNDICAEREEKHQGIMWDREDENERKKTTAALDRLQALENRYRNEDTRMMVRLVKVRSSLWT